MVRSVVQPTGQPPATVIALATVTARPTLRRPEDFFEDDTSHNLQVVVRDSAISGSGGFARRDIMKGAIVALYKGGEHKSYAQVTH